MTRRGIASRDVVFSKKKGATGASGGDEVTKDEETRQGNMVDGTERTTFHVPKLDLSALNVQHENEELGLLREEVRAWSKRKILPETLDPWILA